MSATVPTASAQVPTMSVKKIFRESRRPQATAKPYSIEDIQFHASELRAKVYEKFKNIGVIVFPNYDLLVARWQKESIKDRQDTLRNAWGDIPQNHRPEAFDAVEPAKRVGKLCPDYYMIPFVNIQDLQHKNLLLTLLDARSRHPPHTFARTELLFAPYGKVDVQSLDRSPLLKMQIDNARQYGTVQTFASEQKAMDFEDEGRGVRPVNGLQVIYLQDLLLGFLLNITKLILHDKNESIDFARRPAAPAPLEGLYDEEPSRLFEMAVMQPLRPREGLQLDRIISLVSAECLRAHDLVWDMREDPRHFEDWYCLLADHDIVQIPDVHGRVDPITTKIEFVSYTLHMLVARSHYTLVLWDQLQSHLKKVQTLFADSPGGVDLKTMTPIELVEAIQQLHVLLARVRQMTVEELGWFTASPEFRSLYVRLSDTETEAKIERSVEFTKKKNEVKADVCTILEQIREPHIFADDRYYLEVLETFLPVHSEKDLDRSAEGYISTPVTEAITKLWILAECALELEKQPWDVKVALATLRKRMKSRHSSRSFKALQLHGTKSSPKLVLKASLQTHSSANLALNSTTTSKPPNRERKTSTCCARPKQTWTPSGTMSTTTSRSSAATGSKAYSSASYPSLDQCTGPFHGASATTPRLASLLPSKIYTTPSRSHSLTSSTTPPSRSPVTSASLPSPKRPRRRLAALPIPLKQTPNPRANPLPNHDSNSP
jgi:hypothetical protein